ncbi:hypothetical protein HY385_01040 [Candidatus Daviesbacteria bacterium]|nr:hypothetical protein [Candidatus Daviesbacteria bacterium]
MELLKQEKESAPKNRAMKLIRILAVGFLLIAVIEIWMVSRLSTYGNKIQELKVAQVSLELENQVLENMIAQKASLAAMEQKATQLGFSSVKNIEYLKLANVLAAQ